MPPQFRKILLIANPASRPGQVKGSIPGIVNLLREGGAEVEAVVTERAGDPARLAREASDRFEAVLVAGGDGSINEVLGALQGSSIPLGILPLGTVNVFAREMGIPLHPLEAAKAFMTGRETCFDLGRIGNRRFLLMASFGFDALALRKNPRLLKRLLGRYGYPVTGFLLWSFYRESFIKVSSGSAPSREANFAVFSNVKSYAGKYQVAPEADPCDGLLNVTLFRCPGRLGLLRIFFSFLRGDFLDRPWVYKEKAERVRFETAARERFQIDGDPIEADSGEIAVERSAARIVMPPRHEAAGGR